MPKQQRSSLTLLATVALSVGVLPLSGCDPSTPAGEADAHDHGHDHDHDHGHRPASLHAAVASLDEMHEAIRVAIVEGNADDAHDPLHEIGALLEAIPEVAAETDLPKEEWDAVKAANDRLFDAFGAVDKAFHQKDGDKKAAYEGVATELNEAIEEIRSRLALTGESPETGHDHDGHDHGHEGHDHDEAHANSVDSSAGGEDAE